jgi:hypothetical protein
MGFLNKAFRKVKKQIQPGNMIARDMGPGNMPRRPDIFGRDSFLFGRKPDMTSIRMPQKRGGGFGNLGEAIRRMQEQGGMGMPRMEGRPINQYMGSPGGTPGFYDREMAKVNPIRPGMDDGRVYAGGSPGLYAPGGRFNPGNNPGMNFGEQMPTLQEPRQALAKKNLIARRDPSALERLPMGGAPSFNPTIFGQPIPQGADFSNMPDFSQIDMSQLDLSGIPQSISQMNLPQMPEGLPSIEEIQGNRRMPQMRMGEMQPRMMMAKGDEVFMPSNPNQIAFSIETEIKNLMNEYEMAANNGEIERAQKVVEQINELEARRIQAMNEAKAMESGRTISDMDRQQTGRTISDLGRGRTISDLGRGRTISDLDRGRTFLIWTDK